MRSVGIIQTSCIRSIHNIFRILRKIILFLFLDSCALRSAAIFSSLVLAFDSARSASTKRLSLLTYLFWSLVRLWTRHLQFLLKKSLLRHFFSFHHEDMKKSINTERVNSCLSILTLTFGCFCQIFEPVSLIFARKDSRSSKVSGRFVTSRSSADG